MDDDKEKYWRWLEEMWDVQKFDVHGSTKREEKRKEDILEVFEDLGEITQRRVEAPHFRLGTLPMRIEMKGLLKLPRRLS